MIKNIPLSHILGVMIASAGLALASAPDSLAKSTPTGFEMNQPNSTIVVDHSAWGDFLATYIVPKDGINFVRYSAVSAADKLKLNTYIASLEAIDPTSLNASEAFAFWANLYNAVTVKVILEHYPLKSIKDISYGAFTRGPWKQELVSINGQQLTLDNIEHGILRVAWDEPRVHYAVNCASYGCPNLGAEPFSGATLDDQLTTAAISFINHPRGAMVKKDKVIVSSIYKWFREDFGGTEKGVLAHLNQYATGDLAEALKGHSDIDKYQYNWSLNDAVKQGKTAK